MVKHATTEDMKTLASCINKLVLDGYTANFQVTNEGLFSIEKNKHYRPQDVHIVNFFRFEGASDPADNAILYAIELSDGTKGTLTDAYGPYSDVEVEKFVKQVEDINKKMKKQN
ncbi:MAG TPA: hypothetical protein VFI06_00105 [Chitinophagaceae bacterium]|nr:hypothetical protein [Chitinophagaceae bacterium]